MAAPFEVHQSSIKCYRTCRQMYHYRYHESLQRKRRPNPLVRGTIVHRMVELAQHSQDPFIALKEAEKKYGRLFAEEKEEYGDLIGDIRRLMSGYFTWYEHDPLKPIKVKGKLAVELPFLVPLAPGIVLGGKIDRVAASRDKRRWLEDTKSHKTLPEGDMNYSDIQTALYQWALEKAHGIAIDGIAWNYIRYKPPAIPEKLASGELTRRNIDTTWSVYLAEIKHQKLDPSDYEDMRDKLKGKEGTFFVRSYLPTNPKIIANIVEEATITAVEMKQGLSPVRTIGRHCDWCEYRGLCQAELRGLDAAAVRRLDYETKPKDDGLEIEQE